MYDIRSETRRSVGFAGRLAVAGLIVGAAALLTTPASAGGLLGGGLGVGAGAGASASASVGGSQAGADTQARSSSSASSESRSVDVGNQTGLGVAAAGNVGDKLDAAVGLGADSATGVSISRSHPSSSDDDVESSAASIGAAAGARSATDAQVSAGRSGEGGAEPVALLDASVATEAAAAADVNARHARGERTTN